MSRYLSGQYLFLFFKGLMILCVQDTFHQTWLKIGDINLVGWRGVISRKKAA